LTHILVSFAYVSAESQSWQKKTFIDIHDHYINGTHWETVICM